MVLMHMGVVMDGLRSPFKYMIMRTHNCALEFKLVNFYGIS